jgi:hypothetical protein
MEIRGVCGFVLMEERVGSGWMGEGSGYKMGWRGAWLKCGGSWMDILLLMVEEVVMVVVLVAVIVIAVVQVKCSSRGNWMT